MKIKKNYFAILLFCGTFSIWNTVSAYSSSTFTAAVVDYRPLTKVTNGQSLSVENARNYVTFIKKAASHYADIIVFPDNGLVTFSSNSTEAFAIPSPMHNTLLCGDRRNKYNRAVTMISCAAKMYNMYVVITHPEREDCPSPNCRYDDVDSVVFNTNIVFDRRGRIIARYRKFHSTVKSWDEMSAKAVHSIFHTDFDVIFGQVTCRDLWSNTHASELLQFLGLSYAIFSDEPRSNYSHLCPNKKLADWSYENGITLLRAGYNEPNFGKRSSGIYSGSEGTIHEVQMNGGSNFLIVAELPKTNHGVEASRSNHVYASIYQLTESDLSTTDPVYSLEEVNNNDFITEIIPNTVGEYTSLRCDFGFCCFFHTVGEFNETLTNQNEASYYRYRIMVSRGTRPHYGNGYDVGTDVCGIITCTDDTLESCGKVFPWNTTVVEPTTFSQINISYTAQTPVKSCISSRFLTRDSNVYSSPFWNSKLYHFTRLIQFPNLYTDNVIWNVTEFTPSTISDEWFCNATSGTWVTLEKSKISKLQSSAIYIKKWALHAAYVAAVVQYEPVSEAPCVNNIKNYVKFIEQANKSNVDIIVFPDFGLKDLNMTDISSRASYIPKPSKRLTLCNRTNNYAEDLSVLSCAAKRSNMYVIINYPEKVRCHYTKCPKNEFIFFDTTIVFNRRGKVIARHRNFKYGENSTIIQMTDIETSVFRTDFKVPFILVNCFNIIDRSSIFEMLKDRNNSDIIYTDHLDHHAPLDCNAERLAYLSQEYNMNVLKSGGRNSGCGIYAGNQGIVKESTSDNSDKLAIAEIPIITQGDRQQAVDYEKVKIYKFHKCIVSGVDSIFQSETISQLQWPFNDDDKSRNL